MEPGNKHKSVVNAGKANVFGFSAALDYLEFSSAENISLKNDVKELEATMKLLEEESDRLALAYSKLDDQFVFVVKRANGLDRALARECHARIKNEKLVRKANVDIVDFKKQLDVSRCAYEQSQRDFRFAEQTMNELRERLNVVRGQYEQLQGVAVDLEQALVHAETDADFAGDFLAELRDVSECLKALDVKYSALVDKQDFVLKRAAGLQKSLNSCRSAAAKYAVCETAHASLKPVLEKFVDAVAPVKGDIPAVDTTVAETVLETLPDALTHVARAYNTVRMNVAASQTAYQRVQDENAKLQLDYDEKVAELDVADKLFEAEAHAKDALLAEKSALENKYDKLEKENDVAKSFLTNLVGRLDGIDNGFKTIAQGLRDKLAVCT